MAETMTALVERNRAHLAAHSAACAQTDWNRETEAAFFASADTAAGTTIEANPPRLRDKTDLVAAISYVAEDVDFLQPGHGRVLARVLEYLAEPKPDPFVARMAAFREECVRYNASPRDDEVLPDSVFSAEMERGDVAVTSAAGAAEALRFVLDEDVLGDTFAEDLTRAALAFLSGESAATKRAASQATVAEGESIEDMACRLRAIYDRDSSVMTDAEAEASCREFDALQEAIISAEPMTPRDVALQFMADTHYSKSDLSDGFVVRLVALAGQEAGR